jgi:hypothetical protein
MIWANLLHLGYNMWEDITVDFPDRPAVTARSWREHLRCDEGLWRDITDQMAVAGMNMVVIDLGEGVRYDCHPELAVEGSWSHEKLRAELARLRAMGLEPIPKMNFSTAHDAWLRDYGRMISTARYYEVLKNLIAEAIELFDKPRFFHLGMDEETFGHQRFSEYAIVRQGDLWWRDLYFMLEQVEGHGVRPWTWSDYAWHFPERFYAKMPKSVLQSNWYYGAGFEGLEKAEGTGPAVRVQTYRDLDEHGYDQVPTGSNWVTPTNFEGTVDFCRKYVSPERLLGFMTAPWHPTLEVQRENHVAAVEQVAKVIADRN